MSETDFMGYPTVVKRRKVLRDWKGKVVKELDQTVQPATDALHQRTGSAGADHQSEYATVVPNLHQASGYQEPGQSDFSTKTPAHSEIHLSILSLLPKLDLSQMALGPDELAESEGTGGANLDSLKRKTRSHIEGEPT